MNPPVDFKKLEVRDPEDGTRLVSPAVDIVLYITRDLSSIGPALLRVYDRFLELCPPDRLKWFTTEHMAEHKPVTQRSLNTLRGWLKPGAPHRDTISIEIRDGEHWYDTADYQFFLYGAEEGMRTRGVVANMLRMSFPPEWGIDKAGDLLELTRELCAGIPFQSGHAGFVFQTTEYDESESFTAAYKLAMRYRGFDIQNEIGDMVAVRQDGIKGVNWLTCLCSAYVERLEGERALRGSLPKGVEIVDVKGGLILKAGPAPIRGDVNRREDLSLYKAVYKAVEPLQKPTLDRYGAFSLHGGTASERTIAWHQRLSPEE